VADLVLGSVALFANALWIDAQTPARRSLRSRSIRRPRGAVRCAL